MLSGKKWFMSGLTQVEGCMAVCTLELRVGCQIWVLWQTYLTSKISSQIKSE